MKSKTFLITGTACIAAIGFATLSTAFAQSAPVEFGTNPNKGKSTRVITTTPAQIEVAANGETQAYSSNSTYTGLSSEVYANAQSEASVSLASANTQDSLSYGQVKDLNEAETFPIKDGEVYILTDNDQERPELITTSAAMRQGELTVQSGDTVYGLSRKLNIAPLDLIQANNLQSPYKLSQGQVLVVPSNADMPSFPTLEKMSQTNQPQATAAVTTTQTTSAPSQVAGAVGSVHVVSVGDTMYNVSKRYNVSVNQLAQANSIGAPYNINVGQKLLVPGASYAAVSAGKAPVVTTTSNQTTHNDSNYQNAVMTGSSQASIEYMRGETMGNSRFQWPLQGQVISGFGASGNGQRNDGINIASQIGAPIRAVDDGVVIYRGEDLDSYGNLLLVRHSNGWVSAYGHADSMLVQKDMQVTKGQVIAKVGQTGKVTQPQLHFELRHNLNPKDPLAALEGRDPLAVAK